ncbi:MAG: tautomerase family protein [Clostridia bacterium]|nr:tautomerase family protein [Clostridia bacterium]MBQ4637409.1 tautomerase family protein [Clostridia bacterium]
MPFVSVQTSAKLTCEQKIEIKTRLADLITIIPGKDEKGLMIDISDCHTMFHAGEANDGIAFVDVRLLGKAPEDEKRQFIAAVCDMLSEVAKTNVSNTYINIFEMMQWGSRGKFIVLEDK